MDQGCQLLALALGCDCAACAHTRAAWVVAYEETLWDVLAQRAQAHETTGG